MGMQFDLNNYKKQNGHQLNGDAQKQMSPTQESQNGDQDTQNGASGGRGRKPPTATGKPKKAEWNSSGTRHLTPVTPSEYLNFIRFHVRQRITQVSATSL